MVKIVVQPASCALDKVCTTDLVNRSRLHAAETGASVSKLIINALKD